MPGQKNNKLVDDFSILAKQVMAMGELNDHITVSVVAGGISYQLVPAPMIVLLILENPIKYLYLAEVRVIAEPDAKGLPNHDDLALFGDSVKEHLQVDFHDHTHYAQKWAEIASANFTVLASWLVQLRNS